jgi:hypothetical protein
MAQLTELNKISIAQIAFFSISLVAAIILATRHGWGRASGWLFLVLVSFIRILGGALQLATISDPTNIGLAIGASTLQGIGLTALILVMLGFLSRVLESIRLTHETFFTPRHVRLVQLLVMVALILSIVGGSKLGSVVTQAIKEGKQSYDIPVETKAGVGLMIAAFALLTLGTIRTSMQINYAEPGEKRLILANALALPFVLVRLVYSALVTFDNSNADFRSFNGSVHYADYLLGMAVVMEMVAVAIFEIIGLTLHKRTVGRKADNDIALETQNSPEYYQTSGVSRA